MQTKLNRTIVKYRNNKPVGLVLLFVLLNGLVTPDRLHAVGFRLPNQDPEAIARGDAFAATADNPSAIFYNPAGITQLEGQELSVGIYAISPGEKFTSPGGVTAKANSDFQPVPQIYYTCSFTNVPVSIGLGIYCPYGLALDWGNNTPFSTLGESGKVLYLSFNPVIAWRINRTLSIAAGPTINYSQATLKEAIGLSPGDQFRLNGDGVAFGFNAAFCGSRIRCGRSASITVRRRQSITEGTSSRFSAILSTSTSSSASIHFPQYIVGGISFRPTPNWNLEFDVDWTDWDNVKQIDFLQHSIWQSFHAELELSAPVSYMNLASRDSSARVTSPASVTFTAKIPARTQISTR